MQRNAAKQRKQSNESKAKQGNAKQNDVCRFYSSLALSGVGWRYKCWLLAAAGSRAVPTELRCGAPEAGTSSLQGSCEHCERV